MTMERYSFHRMLQCYEVYFKEGSLVVVFHSLKHDHKENRMRLYPQVYS